MRASQGNASFAPRGGGAISALWLGRQKREIAILPASFVLRQDLRAREAKMDATVPTPSLERIRRSPPCFSTICRMIQRPNPVPLGPLVVKNGVKSLGVRARGIPRPESATHRLYPGCCEGSFRLGRTEMYSLPSGESAASEFSIRLIKICRISPGWAVMIGSCPTNFVMTDTLADAMWARSRMRTSSVTCFKFTFMGCADSR